MNPPTATLPLSGVRVLDCSRILAGPVCCQLLADLGADVVKVERPGTGDDTRGWGPPFLPDDGPSAYFVSANRGKRSLALDLAHPQGRATLDDLLRQADVLVENFLPDALAKLRLQRADLQAVNPRLVVCSISGYGRTGPLASAPGYDLAIQATTGLMAITGPADGPPIKVGVAITDVLTGLYAAVTALAGLRSRERSGAAPTFDLALADCTLASLVNVAQAALITGERPPRYGNAHPQIVPYEVLATADGHLALAVGNDEQWRRFAGAAGLEALARDARFAANVDRVRRREELIPLVQRALRRKTTAQWQAIFTAVEVPHAVVRALDEALGCPQTTARGMVQTVCDGSGRRYRVVGSPVRMADGPALVSRAAPLLGEHTGEVLRDWLQYDAAQIAALRQCGAMG